MLTEAASSVPVSELLSDEVVSAAASVPVTPAPYAGEVAAAAAESFPPVAALQYLLDAVQSFTGLNWYAFVGAAQGFLASVSSCKRPAMWFHLPAR
jgi:YidC/Oxa1 family membrane protein insertase